MFAAWRETLAQRPYIPILATSEHFARLELDRERRISDPLIDKE